MKFIDLVKETTLTEGTGNFVLAGAVDGFRAFSAGYSVGDLVPYAIRFGAQFEIGVGTMVSGGIARTTVTASSNAGALVSFATGTKEIFVNASGDFLTGLAIGDLPTASSIPDTYVMELYDPSTGNSYKATIAALKSVFGSAATVTVLNGTAMAVAVATGTLVPTGLNGTAAAVAKVTAALTTSISMSGSAAAVAAASAAFAVTTVAYTITGYNSNAVKSTVDASAATVFTPLKQITPNNATAGQFTASNYWNINATSGGAQPASATSGWSQSNTTPPADCTQAANTNGGSSINGMTPMNKSAAFSSNSNLWVPVGSGTTTWYFWIKPSDGAPYCVNPGGMIVTGA